MKERTRKPTTHTAINMWSPQPLDLEWEQEVEQNMAESRHRPPRSPLSEVIFTLWSLFVPFHKVPSPVSPSLAPFTSLPQTKSEEEYFPVSRFLSK